MPGIYLGSYKILLEEDRIVIINVIFPDDAALLKFPVFIFFFNMFCHSCSPISEEHSIYQPPCLLSCAHLLLICIDSSWLIYRIDLMFQPFEINTPEGLGF